jgi:exodeoxyribonuclease V alpha subunit
MASNFELTATWRGERHAFGDDPQRRMVIGDGRLLDRKGVTLRGNAAPGALIEGLTYRFFGQYKTHPKYGSQFQFSSFVEEAPVDEDSVIAYLTQCKGPERGSVSQRVATLLVNKYGIEAVDKLIESPAEAAEGIAQWTAEKAGIAAKILREQRGTQRTKMDLIQILDGSRAPKRTVDRAIKEWGTAAAAKVRENPFVLCRFPGIAFQLADQIYQRLQRATCKDNHAAYQTAMAALCRQVEALTDAVSRETRSSGSTWHAIGWASSKLRAVLSGAEPRFEEALAECRVTGRLQTRDGFVALHQCAEHELDVADFCGDVVARNAVIDWPAIKAIELQAPADKPLSDHQLDAIVAATNGRIGCLQGSPGVGKTFSVACIVKALLKSHGAETVAVCAPTGKAAVRVTQSLAANGVDLTASTIHRLLGVASESGEGWSFVHNSQNPLTQRFLIVDESSMIDVDLMAALLRACTKTTHILFVGDDNQLPPVGHGRPFSDLQKIVPTGRLTEIRRNSGRIVQTCAEIRDHRKFSAAVTMDLPNGENLVLYECSEPDAADVMLGLVQWLAPHCEDVVEQVQIVCGKNDRRKALNGMLQKALNSAGACHEGNPFRIGDKIVCLANGTYPDAEEKTVAHFVANGELGRVLRIQPGRMVVALSDPQRSVLVTHAAVREDDRQTSEGEESSRGALGDWDLGYCLSVHRSQGSQWRFVIVVADRAAAMVQSRQWVYTAISRAERATLVIGQRATLEQSMRREGISGRKTMLVELCNRHTAARVVDHESLWETV